MMKKIKLLTPVLTIGGLATTITPLMLITSCACSALGNLMEEYTPSIKQKDAKKYDNPKAALKSYLLDVKDNNEIFVQDMLYTLSRGLPQYESYVSEHCEVKSFNFNANVKVVSVDTDNMNVVFDLTFDQEFDFTGTKPEELIWYDMPYIKANTSSVIRFTLDLDTYTKFENVNAQRRQMTTFAGATQFGISELGSTIQVLSEKGTYTSLNGDEIKVDTKEKTIEYPFILPQKDYWVKSETPDEIKTYYDRYNFVSAVWFDTPSAEVAVLLIKYYMSSNKWSAAATPSTLSFGSYYMANASLKDTFTYTVSKLPGTDTNVASIRGLNFSLDSINNAANIAADTENFKNGEYTIPLSIDGMNVSTITRGAFDGTLSTYTNLGIPSNVTSLVIPGGKTYKVVTSDDNYFGIQTQAFNTNYSIRSIKFNKPQYETESANYPTVSREAFISMHALEEIDFSSYSTGAAAILNSDNTKFKDTFVAVHLGTGIPSAGPEGVFYYPKDGDLTAWTQFAKNLGLEIYNKETHPNGGWEIKSK